MDDFNNNKFWVAIGRCGAFTENDNHIFRVWPDNEQYTKNQSRDLMPKFIEASDLEDARRRIHWFVDKMFGDFYVPADKGSGTYIPPAPSPAMDGMDSLTIECEPGTETKPNPEPKSSNEGLLNLKDLV